MSVPTFGVCRCDHGEHMHNLARDQRTRKECSLYRCDCPRYDEVERYSLRLVAQPVIGDPKPED